MLRSIAGIAIALGVVAGAAPAASAAANPYQRGPDPTPASIAAVTGPFATASVTVPRGNGFGGGVIYYPTATNEGTFGGIAISPGLNGTWPGIAWLGPRLASQGVQGRSEPQRELLDVESVAGHLLKPGSVFTFLAEHRGALFPDELFADLFPTGRGRPSVPADVMAAVITLQALHNLSE